MGLEPDGSNANGTVYIPNPSVQTIQMVSYTSPPLAVNLPLPNTSQGTVTMDLSVAGTPIGTSTIENLILHPGNNTYPMKSTTNQTLVLNMLQMPQYKSGILPLDILGNSSVFNGQHLPYFESALKSNPLRVDLNVGAAIARLEAELSGGGGGGGSSSSSSSSGSSSATGGLGFGAPASSSSSQSFQGYPLTSLVFSSAAPAATGSSSDSFRGYPLSSLVFSTTPTTAAAAASSAVGGFGFGASSAVSSANPFATVATATAR